MMKKKLVKDGERAYNIVFNIRQSILSCTQSKARNDIVNKLNNVLGTLDSATDGIYMLPIGDFELSIKKDLAKAKKKVKKLEGLLEAKDENVFIGSSQLSQSDNAYTRE